MARFIPIPMTPELQKLNMPYTVVTKHAAVKEAYEALSLVLQRGAEPILSNVGDGNGRSECRVFWQAEQTFWSLTHE